MLEHASKLFEHVSYVGWIVAAYYIHLFADHWCSLARWWGTSSVAARVFWIAVVFGLLRSVVDFPFTLFIIIERLIYELGRRLAPTDPVDLRALAKRHVKARELRARLVDRLDLLDKLRCLVERSGTFNVTAVLERGAEFERLLDEWLATLRPGAANNVSRDSFREQLRTRCEQAIVESQEHGARLAAVLREIAMVRDGVEKIIEGTRFRASSPLNPGDVLLELKQFVSEGRMLSHAQLRCTSDRTLAAVIAELEGAAVLFAAGSTEGMVDAWGVSAKLAAAIEAVDAELALFRERKIQTTLASKVRTNLIGACTALRQEIEHWQAIAERARNCELSMQASPADGDDRCCIVCMDAPKSVMLEPCRHLNLCKSCARNVAQCPTCRVPVQDRKVVYF
jgi:hypothetical protein